MSAVEIRKSGQGYWVRMLSAVGGGILVLACAGWLWNELSAIQGNYRIFVQSGVAVGIIAVGGGLLLWLIGMNAKVVDFMIATEAEMRKVAWPTTKEVVNFTWTVIVGTFMIAAFLYVIDLFFAWGFKSIGVLTF